MLKLAQGFLLAVVVLAQQAFAETYEAGKHYEVLPEAVITRDKSKVEVIELFWYGCGHCFHFEPMLQAWNKQRPEYVDFHRMPAMWNGNMTLHAKAFYTAKALGIEEKTHEKIFKAMNIEKKRLRSEDEIAAFFARFGIDDETFRKTFNSFGVDSQVKLAQSRARSYRLQGTPEMVVNGKYRVSTSLTGSQEKMLKVVNFLIEKERAELAK